MFLYIRDVYKLGMEYEGSETAPKKATHCINELPNLPLN